MSAFSWQVQAFARRFILMQQERNHADYDPLSGFTREEVLLLIQETETVIKYFRNASPSDRRAFAAHVLLRSRRN